MLYEVYLVSISNNNRLWTILINIVWYSSDDANNFCEASISTQCPMVKMLLQLLIALLLPRTVLQTPYAFLCKKNTTLFSFFNLNTNVTQLFCDLYIMLIYYNFCDKI